MSETSESPRLRVRPKAKAAKAIFDYLDTNDVALPEGMGRSEVGDAVAKAVDVLYDAYEGGDTVPTREAFAERCDVSPISEAVLSMPEDPFARKPLSRGRIAAICAGCGLAVMLLVGGTIWALVPQPQVAADVDAPIVASTTEDRQTDGTVVRSQDDETESDDAGAESQDDDGSSSSGTTPDDTGGTTLPDTPSDSSRPSSDGSGSGDTSSQQPAQPQHAHNWVPITTTVHHDAVYQTVHHDAEYKTVHHDAVTENRSICNSCGADITGNESAHMKEYALKGDMTHSYSVKPVVVQAAYNENVLVKDAWDERVLVSDAWDETVTTGYRCSTCGATK